MNVSREQLQEDFDLFSFYLTRYRQTLKSIEGRFGVDSREADGWRAQVRATEDAMIDIGRKLGQMNRAY
jgi:hypothetical protein